jgi:sirohydrochlorin cobaltochelatase
MTNQIDLRAPMASAPMKYNEDGSVNWGDMWDTFCVLAQEGGPPHRADLLDAPEEPNSNDPRYAEVSAEITRGIFEVSGLKTRAAEPGWLAIETDSPGHALWLQRAIVQENVQAQARGNLLLVPVSQEFTLKGEIKNVITVVAKTTHYWTEHLQGEFKRAADTEVQLDKWIGRVKKLFGRAEVADKVPSGG